MARKGEVKLKDTYMVVDTDFNTYEFTDLKEAQRFYMEKVEDVIKDSTVFDSDIKFLVVTDRFTKKKLEDYQQTALEVIKEGFSFNVPTEEKR